MFFNKGAAGKKLDYFLSFFQYYIHTKNPLPMDIEFIVQDIFALTRPQWKLASNLEEATKVFTLAMAQDQKTSGLDKIAEQDDGASDDSSDDDNGDDPALGEQDEDDDSGSEEADQEVCNTTSNSKLVSQTNHVRRPQELDQNQSSRDSDSEEEAIVVTREEEEVNPEDEADFEREYAKMMAESLESRKFERKQQFDLPLPVRTKLRDPGAVNEPAEGASESPNPPGTMAFSLLTKRGNRQQVQIMVVLSPDCNLLTPCQTRTVELPSDSHFAIAMKTQQEAEKEEHQRIKNLVLNYDLRESEDHDGEAHLLPLKPNTNIHIYSSTGHEKPNSHHHNRLDNRSAKERAGQRVRKLQLSDVDWYGNSQKSHFPGAPVAVKARPTQAGSARSRRAISHERPEAYTVGQKRAVTGNNRIDSSPGAARRSFRLPGGAVA